MRKYFGVHNHTMYSNLRLLDSINRPKDLIDTAIQLGLSGIAITDHESLGAHVEVNKYAEEVYKEHPDFTIALGNEIYLIDGERGNDQKKYYHFILISKDAIGHRALRELSSTAWFYGYESRRQERVPTLKSELIDIVERYKGHLIATTACIGGELPSLLLQKWKSLPKEENDNFMNSLLAADVEEYNKKINNFLALMLRLFGEDFYIECAPSDKPDQILANQLLREVAEEWNIKMVVGTDAHYLTKDQRAIHKAYLTSKEGEREVDEFYEFARLMDSDEVEQLLNLSFQNKPFVQEILDNTLEIQSKIKRYSLFHKQDIPEVPVKNYEPSAWWGVNNDYADDMKHSYPTLCKLFTSKDPQDRYWVNENWNKLDEMNKGWVHACETGDYTYLDRLEEEARVKSIISEKLETNMFRYPNTLQHYIDLIWDCGSMVGAGRGSSCAALNHYLMGITQLDPIEWDLPFFRYLNEERIELGDIDIDICPSKREEIFSHIREEVGQLGCVQVCTYGTETTRSAIATACRGYRSHDFPDGIDNDVAQYMTSLAPSERGFVWPIHDLVYGNEEKDRKPVKNFLVEVNKYPGLLEIIEKIEGLINHRGIHASGVNFYMNDPFDSACFMKATSGAIVTQFSLHDAEYCGDVKFDFLVTEIQDVIVQCLNMLQEYNEVDQDLTLRQLYDKYLHPDVLPIEDKKMWDVLAEGNVLKLFQFDSQVGSQTVKLLRPKSPREMANCNSVMRLMASEKGGETPTERYKRMKRDMSQWYAEMQRWGISRTDQKILEKYYLETYATPAQQEDMMMILMDENICNFSLKEANDARKICAKKQMNRIDELHELVLQKATSRQLGEYVWETAIKPQMGYSFSLIHSLAYSFVGLQTIYLATYFDPVYWNTACLRVDAGLDEDASSNYGKIAKAVGNIIHRGIPMSLIDINKSGYMFEPDIETGSIIYGLKGLNGVNGETIQEIINNRPYKGVEDFQNKAKIKKPVLISLIKSGAFDKFGDREQIMKEYIWSICEPKKRITLQNFNGLMERNLIPAELDFEKRLFVYNKALRTYCKVDDYYLIKDNFYDFYEEFFDVDLLEEFEEGLAIKETIWKKLYTKGMDKARDYFKEHQQELLNQLNNTLFQEVWNKYAEGTLATWEMDSLGFYYHEHPLKDINKEIYNIKAYASLPENPEIERKFKRNGVDIPLFKTCRIIGTVVAKEDNKSCISLLTPESGVVTVKMSREYYARINRQISEVQVDGHKKVMEKGWTSKGNLLMVNGFKRSGMFFTKTYKHTKSHQVYHIDKINDDGTLEVTHCRWGEESEE